MSSKTQICNRALILLGMDPLVNVETDATEAATLCNIVFDDLVEEVLSEGDWTAATFRATLAQLEDDPEYEYVNAFQLPTYPKIIRLLSINETNSASIDYKIENNKLLTDENSISIKYIGLLSSTADFGPYITKALISRIAAELAYTGIGQPALIPVLDEKYSRVLKEAIAADRWQGRAPSFEALDLIEVR